MSILLVAPKANVEHPTSNSEHRMQDKMVNISNPDDINPEGGFINYGNIKSQYILVKGSLSGPKNRMLIFTKSMRKTDEQKEMPSITYISTASKQGR